MFKLHITRQSQNVALPSGFHGKPLLCSSSPGTCGTRARWGAKYSGWVLYFDIQTSLRVRRGWYLESCNI